MKLHLWKSIAFGAAAVLGLAIAACNKDASTSASSDVTDAVDAAIYTVQERGGVGPFGCYELIFPVTIILPDSSQAVVNSYDEMKAAIKAYFEANGIPAGAPGHGPGGRPHLSFVYPIDVLNGAGETITVNNDTELRSLRAACAGTFGNHGWQGHGNRPLECFELVFPVTIQFPDSTTQSVASRVELKTAVRTWKQANPGVPGRPQLVFPVTILMKADSSQVVVSSKEELKQIKEDCE